MFRQGDILIVSASDEELRKAERHGHRIGRDQGRLILAYGESTGHAHAIQETPVEMFELENGQFIRAAVPFAVVHEEHAPLNIPVGNFRVIRQREYVPATQNSSFDIRIIAD